MRGLGNGYTQILLDGERVPPGFSLDSLTPDQIERIEILRAPTAETGARALAGTINLITRGGYSRRVNDVRLVAAYENGKVQPSASWTRNFTAGDFHRQLLAQRVPHRPRQQQHDDDDRQPPRRRHGHARADRRRPPARQGGGVNATARIQWRPEGGADSGDADADPVREPLRFAPRRHADLPAHRRRSVALRHRRDDRARTGTSLARPEQFLEWTHRFAPEARASNGAPGSARRSRR